MASQASVEIHVIANKCRSIFATCSESPLLAQQNWFMRALAEFNLWCANLKATRSDKSSLDHRLGSRLDIREDICDLLDGLGTALERCRESSKQEADGTNNPSRQHSGSSSEVDKVSWEAMSYESSDLPSSIDQGVTSHFLAESILYVKTILDQLSRISLAIRRAGNRYRFERIDAELDNAAFEEFRTYLTTVILRACEDPESRKLASTDKARHVSNYDRLSTVQKRLVESDVRRRNRMCSMATSDGNRDAAAKPPSPDEIVGQVDATDAPKTHSNIPPTIVNTATGVESNLDIGKLVGKRPLSHFTTVTRIGASMEYPRPPKSAPEQPPRCPYCGDVIPGELSNPEQEDTWRSHVASHLTPYTCIVAECTEPYELYVSSQALLDHTIQRHSFTCWVCDYCPTGNAEVFTTMASWDSHIAKKHFEDVPSNERAVLGEMSKRQMIGPLECPLCDFTADGPATVVDDHILRHLHEFSLHALPPTGESVGDGSSSSTGSLDALPRMHQNQAGAAIISGEAEVTLDDIHTAISTTWHYFTIDGLSRPRPLLSKPSFSSAAAKEIWQVHAERLINLLKSLKFEMDEKLQCDTQAMYDDAVHLITEMKSAGGSSDEFQPSPTVEVDAKSEPTRHGLLTPSASKDTASGSKRGKRHKSHRREESPGMGFYNNDEHYAATEELGSPFDFEPYFPVVGPLYYGDPAVPRSYQDDGIADLASGMGQMQMADPGVYGGYEEYPNDYPGGATQDGTEMGHSTYTQYSKYYADGDKGKQPAGADGAPDPMGGYPNYGGNYPDAAEGGDNFARAVRESQQTGLWGTYGPPDDAGPSTYGGVEEEPEYVHPTSSLSPNTTQSGSFMITDEHNFVSDPQYKKEHSRKYRPGAVFKTLWAEPHGQAATAEDHPVSEAAASVRSSLKNFYIGIRRFIVVASDHGHSSCVPILTYDQRGCKKPGIDPLQHGIIHTRGSHPHQLRGEPNMGFAPVALDMSVREKLAKESRVNYSKIITVEHATRAYFIGHIEKDDFEIVKLAVDTCRLNKHHGTHAEAKPRSDRRRWGRP